MSFDCELNYYHSAPLHCIGMLQDALMILRFLYPT